MPVPAAVEPSPRSGVALPPPREFAVFGLGGQIYAVAAALLRCCLSLPRLTVLDGTPQHLLGAFDLRGELAPVISPAVLSGLPLRPARCSDLVIVVELHGHPVALHADLVLGVEPVYPSARAPGYTGDQQAGGARIRLVGGEALLIDPALIVLSADTAEADPGAVEARLAAFESGLDRASLQALEERARRYGGLAGAGTRPPGGGWGWGRALSL